LHPLGALGTTSFTFVVIEIGVIRQTFREVQLFESIAGKVGAFDQDVVSEFFAALTNVGRDARFLGARESRLVSDASTKSTSAIFSGVEAILAFLRFEVRVIAEFERNSGVGASATSSVDAVFHELVTAETASFAFSG
jgi:hypothetical protein